MNEEIENLIDKLFVGVEKRVKEHKEAILSKGTRIRHQNGRILDVYLVLLSGNTASIVLVDVKSKVEISAVDIHKQDLQYLSLTYEEACEIYDEILKRNGVVEKYKE